jgi:hypothetical protein
LSNKSKIIDNCKNKTLKFTLFKIYNSIISRNLSRRMGAAGIQERRELQNIWPQRRWNLCDKNILKLALLVPFFGDFFGQAKKLQKLS